MDFTMSAWKQQLFEPPIFAALLSVVGLFAYLSASTEAAAPACPCFNWSCDDYCRKPAPLIYCPKYGCTCDCYHRKPSPMICPACTPYTCDDYVRKPFPCLCCPQLPPKPR